MSENILIGIKNRTLQFLARSAPGAMTTRVWLHRMRGVKIGEGSWIGYDSIIETSQPWLVSIGRNVIINMRVMVIAHFHGSTGVKIGDNVFIGPGAIILPNVTIGEGAVITAGSVVSTSIPPHCLAQGNPARIVAKCTIPLGWNTPTKAFYGGLEPIKRPKT